jgi:hypothetical protein
MFFASCAEEKKFFHVEISCPGRQTILVRYITLKEVQASIARDIEVKKQGGTSEDYTVIYGSGGRSLKISKVSPEDSLKCVLTEIPVINPDKNITKYN